MNPRRAALVDVALGAALVALVALCALRPEADIDVFWHIAVGRWILAHGALPDRDVWSAADPNAPWQSFEWLYQALVAWLEQHAGFRGLQLACVAWYGAAFGAFYALLRARGWTRPFAALLTLVLLTGFHDRLRLRPDACNLVAWLVPTFYVAAKARPRGWHVPAAFAFFALWAAFHRGVAWLAVVCVLAVVAASVVARRVRGRTPSDTLRLAIALAALVGWLAAPGGARALWFVSTQLGATQGYVEEWQSWPAALSALPRARAAPHIAFALALVPCAWAVFALRVVAWLRAMRVAAQRPVAIDALAPLVLALAYLALATAWFRFAYLAALAIVVVLEPRSPSRTSAWAASLGALALALSALQYTTTYAFGSVANALAARRQPIALAQFPDTIARVLVDAGVDARVGTPAGWGGYLLYLGYPRLRVTLDGRMVAPASVLEVTQAVRGVRTTGQHLDALGPLYSLLPADVVVMPHPALYMPSSEWVPLLATSNADLLARRSPWLERYGPALRASIASHRPRAR